MKLSTAVPITLLGVASTVIPSAAADLVLPITFDEYTIPSVSLEIEGEPSALTLDTGSGEGLHLRREVLDRLESVRFTGEMQRSSDMAGKVQENARFVIDELAVQGLTFREIRGVELAPWGITVQEDGQLPETPVLGLGFFEGQRVLIDYPSKELTVFDPSSDFLPNKETGWIEVPFRHSGEGLLLKAEIAGQASDMVLDTGATISFAVADRIASTAEAVPCKSIYASLEQEGCRLIPVKTAFGGQSASFHAFIIEDDSNFEAAGLLGGDFLNQHEVFMDFAGKRMFIRPDQGLND
ncbi:aspartyl protease family protein [Paracoccus aminophilus]|uniref:Peptidase A2 domain-containing protein n=1 Tax=Paracoccus aminophilus JCM 7686 TaxID=1367847 RepID=S5XU33_PARAH|nr:aspartyl protease family protein [Paracoccus aminophilus]AGT11014.1 hypothetical protein JCM7686_pAMI4p326 [Paracoccus aminophilus JCM 7686]